MDRYKSAWQGAAEGINSGIDNAIKLYSARNAQEDQAYKQTLRQREEAEYAEKMKPLGTVGDVVSRYEEGPESRKIMLTTIRTVLGKGENDPLLRHEGEKIMGVLGVDQKKALFDSTGKDVANKIKTMTDAYSKMDKNAPEALATKQEIDSLNQRHLAYTTESRKYQREIDEELRKQAEEKRKEEIHPLEQKKLTAEIGKLNALAAQARARGSAEGGLTPAQTQKEQASKKRDVLKYVDGAIKAYGKIAAEAKKNGSPIPPQIIQGTAMAWDVKKKILSGELNPADVEYHDINNLPDRNNPATQIQPPIAEGVIYTDPQTGARYKLSPDQPENKTNAMEFRVGETGLGATPEKKIYSLEDQLLYGTKRK